MRLHGSASEEDILRIFKDFTGPIYQKPPVRSSVKREVRIRMVYSLDALEISERHVLFHTSCQAGTYIRKICYDIGEVLGCGAHMKELRRTRTGPFTEDNTLVTLQTLQDAYYNWVNNGKEESLRNIIQPMETCLKYMPKIYLRDSAVDAICHGAGLAIPGIVTLESGIKVGDEVALLTQKGEAVALARSELNSQEIIDREHGIAAKTDRVLMTAGTYPRMWQTHEHKQNTDTIDIASRR
jgi:H/ACA ribonucleoprotein complex subunit 4